MPALIVTHELADFDAVAAQVAARKLHPEAQIALPRSFGRDLHPYLALHRDRFAGVALDDVDWASVQRLIVVDVRSRARLGHIGALLERLSADPNALHVIVYDHHAAREDDLPAHEEYVERVGSTTTLLSERLRARGVSIDAVEATLFALGIHADTGSLCFASTTPRDASALAFLLGKGVELDVLARYLRAPTSEEQRAALLSLMTSTERFVIGGLHVGVGEVSLSKSTMGLDDVTTRAHDVLGCHALFALYRQRSGKIQVIARSRASAIDVAAALTPLGGGGHASAAAAAVAGSSSSAVRDAILEGLRAHRPRASTARDLMSSPVHTVSPETPLAELENSLSLWQHSGACVVDHGRPVAAISRRDLERARRAQGLHLKVKSFMSQRLITTTPDASLEAILATMHEHDVGRLPVLERGRLVGIVTRSDVLAALYPERSDPAR